ncbi:hypothetical protein GCM10008955_23120 [Deinococcus malanensis]|uniref:N-acetyltransferase domain-containing protein n=1 Tax=Deinococcus malanensis TaxID=1706855 RepID=A0ABQ2EZQ7_9DEIO|nr:GNAT family N-acetyltransferase [Deinococcus malanensis]GGK28778.1 hypothetical protein GCM10008955_23120 [Deinococcus malanensis]
MSLEIRPALPSDWSVLHPFLETDRPLDSMEAAHARFLRRPNSELHCVLVAVKNGTLVGVAMAHEWDEYLMSGRKQIRCSTLQVLPEWRRQGIGHALFQGVVGWAETGGATWLEWYASPAAVPFYERLGYKGVSCPQPEYPFFEITFPRNVRSSEQS